jgi:hypothetical protein
MNNGFFLYKVNVFFCSTPSFRYTTFIYLSSYTYQLSWNMGYTGWNYASYISSSTYFNILYCYWNLILECLDEGLDKLQCEDTFLRFIVRKCSLWENILAAPAALRPAPWRLIYFSGQQIFSVCKCRPRSK